MATRTRSFGAGNRESHDAAPFYERFTAPELSDDETVNPCRAADSLFCEDARDMQAVDDCSVALVVTSPPYFAGKEYEADLGEGGVPATYLEYLQMLTEVFGNPQPVPADSLAVAEFLEADAANCDVLHFACHGEAAQRAVMRADLLMTGTKVGDDYVTDPLSADVVKTHARFASSGPNPIVFINACQTGKGGAGLSAGVAGFVDAFLRPFTKNGAGALVGALWSVDDKLAFAFAKSFYDELLGRKTLVEAVQAARQAAKGQNDLTWLAYTIYGNPFARVAD